jgi:predicted nucleic acid-binding protein
MVRLLVDASALIAMGSVGALHVLRALDLPIATTRAVLDEVLAGDRPGAAQVRNLHDAGAIVLTDPDQIKAPPPSYGLARGEASVIAAAQTDDVLILDDLSARRVADALSIDHVGTLGILSEAVERGRLPSGDALDILDRLATSDFRMTAELYAAVRSRIEDAGRSGSP